ncbi:MAG: cytochrome c [Nitrospirae bacterium]|nr:cytochrome c [Nitrospirota bacterium]
MNNLCKMVLIVSAMMLVFPLMSFAENDPTTDPGFYPQEYINKKNPLPFNLATLREGRALYTGHCEVCHGVHGDGKGNAAVIGKYKPMPRDFTKSSAISDKSDGMLFYSVSKGVHGTRMFAREEIMKPEQRWAVIHYIRTFAREVNKTN